MEFNVTNSFFTGKFLIHLPSVDSTNSYAKQLLAKTSPIDGTVILADEQFAGRGQAGNLWVSEANKNLTFSIIFHTSFLAASSQFYLNMAISLGIRTMVHRYLLSKQIDEYAITIKWPNDIYVNNRKIGGILIENTIAGMQLKHSVTGIGLNINQDEFATSMNATSLKQLTGEETDLNIALNKVIATIEKYFLLLRERKFEMLRAEYLSCLYRYNMEALYSSNNREFTGKIKGLNEAGCLLVETNRGIEAFNFKEIVFLP